MSAAEAYYARASTLSPGDPEIAAALAQTRRIVWHRVEASFGHEALTGTDAQAGELAVDFRASETLRVSARAQGQHRFGREEARAGGGIEWRVRPDLTIRTLSLFGPAAQVIARTDNSVEIERARGRLETAAAVRYATFSGARVWILSPAATWWLDDRTAVTGRYYASLTRFPQRDTVVNHSALARVRRAVSQRFWVDIAYSRGYESFDTLSVDRLGAFRADTISGGVVYHLQGLQSLGAAVDYQRRSDGRTMLRVTGSVVHRF